VAVLLRRPARRLRARAGVSFAYLPRDESFAFGRDPPEEPVFIDDLAAGEHRTHPLVASGPRVRFIGILPLAAPDGFVVGTLTVLDAKPRKLARAEQVALANLASLVVARLESRREMGESKRPQLESAPAGRTPAERLEQEMRRRREAEEALAREKQFSEAVLDSLAGAFYLLSPEGAILRWNAALVAALGYTDGEIAAMNPLDFVSEKDASRSRRPCARCSSRDARWRSRRRSSTARATCAPTRCPASRCASADSTFMIGVARDITMRKRTEQQMARAKERLDLALTGSRLALWDWDLRNNRVYFNEAGRG
jgi:PAS domain S-box-containing protein